MWLILADDSEQRNPTRSDLGHLVGIGAVLFPEETALAYSEKIDKIRDDIGMPPGEEIKWSPKSGSWLKSEAGRSVRSELQRRMIDAAVDANVKSVTVVWSRGKVSWDLAETRGAVLGFLYDKVSNFLRSQEEPARGIIIADEPGGGSVEHKAWLADTLPLTTNGTRFNSPTQIIMPIVTAPSHHVPQLQLADLVAGATVAAIGGSEYAQEFMPNLLRLARRDSRGRVGGAGLTLWPPQIGNLYFHVCGDKKRSNKGVEYDLPVDSWDYLVG